MPDAPSGVSTPRAQATDLERASAFVAATGLIIDDVAGDRVTGHIDVGPDHHTPWGIVHGGVYAAAIESTATIGATEAVSGEGMVAVGLTNTTHFLRSLAAGRVRVEALALNQGRSQQLWQVNVLDERNKLVAHGEVRLQNLQAS
jgi:uncharacterized protein (TIGR00369 family)